MFCFFDCCPTELYSHLHKLFCAIILDFIPLINKLFILIPYSSRLIFKQFGVNLSRKHFSKNYLCDKKQIFLFLIRSKQNSSFFISSSLFIFFCLDFFAVVFDELQSCCQVSNSFDIWNQRHQFDRLTFLSNQIFLCVNNCLLNQVVRWRLWLFRITSRPPLLQCDIYILNKEW